MIHDLTSNSDFSMKTNDSLLDVDITTEDEMLDLTEVVYTGTSSDRHMKRLINEYESETNTSCHRCGCTIFIKKWDFCRENYAPNLCKNCNQYLNYEYERKPRIYDNFDDNDTHYDIVPYNFIEFDDEPINNIFLWD